MFALLQYKDYTPYFNNIIESILCNLLHNAILHISRICYCILTVFQCIMMKLIIRTLSCVSCVAKHLQPIRKKTEIPFKIRSR